MHALLSECHAMNLNDGMRILALCGSNELKRQRVPRVWPIEVTYVLDVVGSSIA